MIEARPNGSDIGEKVLMRRNGSVGQKERNSLKMEVRLNRHTSSNVNLIGCDKAISDG
jgi:hypothetical protein